MISGGFWGFRHQAVFVVLFAGLLFGLPAKAQAIEIAPTSDAEAALSGGFTIISFNGITINTQFLPGADVDRRGILEFDLSRLPSGVLIDDASIEFYVNVLTSSTDAAGPEARLFAYAGDGIADFRDVTELSTPLAVGSTTTDLGDFVIDLDVSVVNQLISDGSDYLGVLVLGSANGHQFGYSTIESEANGFSAAPRLALTYSIPEPSTSVLMVLVGAWVVGRPRRRAGLV